MGTPYHTVRITKKYGNLGLPQNNIVKWGQVLTLTKIPAVEKKYLIF